MKNQDLKYRIFAAMLIAFYSYFLVISILHIHYQDIEHFTGNIIETENRVHDYYAYDNFCKLTHSSLSLFFAPAGESTNTYISADFITINGSQENLPGNIFSSELLRAPPSEII